MLEVSWQPPADHHHDLIAGYRLYYHTAVAPPGGHDLTDSRWEVKDVRGPLTVTQLTGLKPHTQYTVRVRARAVDGRLGNFSDAGESEDIDITAGQIRCFSLTT